MTADELDAIRPRLLARITYLVLFMLSAPRVFASGGHNDAALATLVWSMLALISEPAPDRIPRARLVR